MVKVFNIPSKIKKSPPLKTITLSDTIKVFKYLKETSKITEGEYINYSGHAVTGYLNHYLEQKKTYIYDKSSKILTAALKAYEQEQTG